LARRERGEIGVVASTVRTKTLATIVNLGYALGGSWEKPIAIAAGARLVPKDTPIAIAPIVAFSHANYFKH
jgi:hypothetical protein